MNDSKIKNSTCPSKTGNISDVILNKNKIQQIVYSLYQSKEITRKNYKAI